MKEKVRWRYKPCYYKYGFISVELGMRIVLESEDVEVV